VSRSHRDRLLGRVTAVTTDRFTIEIGSNLDSFTLVGYDSQHYVARIGSFVLIPLQSEYVVAEVVGLRENDLLPTNKNDFNIEDSPAVLSTKFLEVVPLGTLSYRAEERFKFGVPVYPPLYSDAIYAERKDLDRILNESVGVKSEADDERDTSLSAIAIGDSVVFDDYEVKIRINEFFGGHSAILGNTGSGKSCTVASILQTIFSKEEEHPARGASFIIFDTNGEYRQAFAALPAPISRRYAVVTGSGELDPSILAQERESVIGLRVPHWFLSVEEWELLLRASDRSQKPILRNALGLASLFSSDSESLARIKNHVIASSCLGILQRGESVAASAERIRSLIMVHNTAELNLEILDPNLTNNFGAFTAVGNKNAELIHAEFDQHIIADYINPDYENRPFRFEFLLDALDLAILFEEAHGNRQIRDYCAPLLTRVKAILYRPEYGFIRVDPGSLSPHELSSETFTKWLMGDVQSGEGVRSQITILDMNDIDDELIEIVSTVVTRLTFERLRRLQERNSYPVNLILEEAHRYISNKPHPYGIDANETFARVAKEGRKYGLFIMLASQRPSELLGTVLSQCSNYVVHRIQNPQDLAYIRQITPFISESVLQRLASLPKQHALVFGSAVNVPLTCRVKDARPRPRSDDAMIEDVWFVSDCT
jgi:DNA helicase HerA-like ATPase